MLRVSRSVVEIFLRAIAEGRQPDATKVPELEEMGRRRLEMGIPLEAMLHVYRIAGRSVFNAIVAEIKPGEESSFREVGARWVEYMDQCSTRASTGYIVASNERVRRIEARRTAVLHALLGASDAAEVAAVASEFSLHLAAGYAPVLLAADHGRLDEISDIAPPSSLVGSRGSALLVLAPDTVPDLNAIRRRFGDVLVVWGDVRPPGPELRAEIEHAERVLAAAIARDRRDVLGPDDLVVEQFVLSNRRTAAALGRSVVTRIREKDAGGVLTSTLRTFLECGSIPETAKRLVVHPNTAAYRLRRVAELTGLDPRVPADAAVLVLALATDDLGL